MFASELLMLNNVSLCHCNQIENYLNAGNSDIDHLLSHNAGLSPHTFYSVISKFIKILSVYFLCVLRTARPHGMLACWHVVYVEKEIYKKKNNEKNMRYDVIQSLGHEYLCKLYGKGGPGCQHQSSQGRHIMGHLL